ncbi:MAG: hypothetical protein P8M13_02040 [Luminiphilus sp.]|nr:hypothetical protein [Luminiphilus sp.]
MNKPRYFQLRGNVWQVAMIIPKDVRHIFKATHFRRSTKHRDLNQAQIIGLPWVAEWKQQISRARMEPDTIMADIAKATATAPEGTDPRTGIPHDKISVATWRQIEAWGDHKVIGDSGGFKVTSATLDTDQFGPVVAITGYINDEVDEITVMPLVMNEVISSVIFGNDAASTRTYVPTLLGEQGIPFGQFGEEFVAQYGKSQKDAKSAVNGGAKVFATLDQVNADAVQAWVNTDTRARETVVKHLAILSSYWKFLQGQQYVRQGDSPFNGITLPKSLRKKQSYVPLEWDELLAIRELCDDELQDVVDIARYTGMRIAEICLQDKTVTHQGVECFYVDEKAAKTGASIRYVPVAHEIKHIELRLRNKNAIGKRFGRHKKTVVGNDQCKVFHSIRKNVTTFLERGGVAEGVAADLIGHEKQTITYGLYSGGSSIEQLTAAVDVIRKGNEG